MNKIIVRKISFKKAKRLGLITSYDFKKCFFCGSNELITDKNQEAYSEEVWGTPTFVEGGIVCKKCHAYQGYIAYGQIDPVYVKEPKPSRSLKKIYKQLKKETKKN